MPIRYVKLTESDFADALFWGVWTRPHLLRLNLGKRTGFAALKIAVDFVKEGLCKPEEALLKVEPDHVQQVRLVCLSSGYFVMYGANHFSLFFLPKLDRQVLNPTFPQKVKDSPLYKDNIVAVGLAGGPGAAVGKIVFTTQKAEEMKGEAVLLVRENTSPEDVGGMWAAKGILTSRGGVTSHAAVVARGWGKPCICGCEELEIDAERKTMTVKSTGEVFKEGDLMSLNGSTGEVIRIPIELESAQQDGDFGQLLAWADAVEDTCKVLANADSGPDATKALELGAQGIGLCRTEHMFFAPERLPIVRRWILRDEQLEKIKEFQRSDFYDLLKVMDGKPVTVRLLDPPLHEFLPKVSEVTPEFAKTLGYDDAERLKEDIQDLHEENPMLGLRGCRLGICRPELTEMQVEAIMNAAADLMEEKLNPYPRIMVRVIQLMLIVFFLFGNY